MSTHARQDIREAVVAALLGPLANEPTPIYATSAGARVYETRMIPHHNVKLPAIAVYTLQESSTESQSAPRQLERKMDLAVEAAVMAGEDVDDALDAICLEIEDVMHADDSFGRKAADSILASTELAVATMGKQEVGVAVLVYTVTYRTYAPALDDLDDLSTVSIRHNLSNAQEPDDQAQDVIEDLET